MQSFQTFRIILPAPATANRPGPKSDFRNPPSHSAKFPMFHGSDSATEFRGFNRSDRIYVNRSELDTLAGPIANQPGKYPKELTGTVRYPIQN